MKVTVQQTKSFTLNFDAQKEVACRFLLEKMFGVSEKVPPQKIKDNGKGEFTVWRQLITYDCQIVFIGRTDDPELVERVNIFNQMVDIESSTKPPEVRCEVED